MQSRAVAVGSASRNETNGPANNAVWWAVHYQGAVDYAQSLHDSDQSSPSDIEQARGLVAGRRAEGVHPRRRTHRQPFPAEPARGRRVNRSAAGTV